MRSADINFPPSPAALKRTLTAPPADAWESRIRALMADLAKIIPIGQSFLFVDSEEIRTSLVGFAAIPFPERDGEWSGPPADDAAAAQELERQRRAGASFIVFAWPAFWWLDYYVKFHRILRWGFPCILRNERLMAFDLRSPGQLRGATRRVAARLPRISGIDLPYGRISQVFAGLRWWLGMSRIAWTGTGSAARHLCELIQSTESSGLPRVGLAEILERLGQQSEGRRPDRVFVHPLLRGCGSGAAAEIAALAVITAAKRPGQILEFGTYDGAGTWHMWANSDGSARITTLDLPPNTKVKGSTDLGLQGIAHRPFLPADSRVRLIETDSRAWQPDVRGVDLCFIDAGHSYECVKNDSEKALPLMSAGGVIVWHDATWRRHGYGVNRYLREKWQEGLDIRQLVIGDFDFCCMAILIT
jgi:predicted O-methyltransferase YrrM